MNCLKTGCYCFIEQYSAYAYGDAFLGNNTFVFRLVDVKYNGPRQGKLHFTIHDVGLWFDKDSRVSTLISDDVTYHGYDGI